MSSIHDHIQAGQIALTTAHWPLAKQHFEAVLAEDDLPEAHDGLGIALWWLNAISASHEQRMAAFVGFKHSGDLRRAGRIAAWLAREQVFLYTNSSAMKGWFARAERLLSSIDPCPEQGWLALMRGSMLEPPEQLAQTAQTAAEIAQTFADANLEAFALAFKGMALVALGSIADGMTCLDEAMTMATSGEVRDFMTISEVFCVTLSACELAGDLTRCEHWCQAAAQFAERYSCPFLAAYCRTTYGSLQVAAGRWQEAETTLTDAIRLFDAGHRGLRVQAVIKLAELRVYQGKLEEAEVLLTGYEDNPAVVAPLARLYTARQQIEQARALLDQALQAVDPPRLEHLPLLFLLVEVALLQNDLNTAQQAIAALRRLAAATQSDVLLAQVALVEGQVKQRLGSADAQGCFQAAVTRLQTQDNSLLAGRARFEMAQCLSATDRAGAVTWARAALATFERIGAQHDAAQAANLVRQLGGVVRPAMRTQAILTERENEILALVAKGLTNRDIAERLVISPKTVESHVSQILGKLGVRRRAEAIAFVTQQPFTETTPSAIHPTKDQGMGSGESPM
ncbi:MAG: hypothetical protein IT324_08090 [Anaerolineae bacterium]|nr:hypothetical protein [Anaerolineae bacterium]